MASREGQGMQIAVILFALVSAVLAITTYVFYAEANKLDGLLKTAEANAQNNDKGQKTANYKLAALKYTMGIERDASKLEAAKAQAGGAEDAEVTAWISQYKNDVQILGDDPNNPQENYRDMVNRFLNIIASKNESVSTTNATTATTLAQKDKLIEDLTNAKKKAEDDLQTAINDYNAAKQQFNDQLAQATKEKDDLKTQYEEDKKTLDASITTLNNQIADLNKQIGTLQQSLTSAQAFVEDLEADQGVNFDNPDGLVIWVNQRQRLTWINLGSADGLARQMTFSVFSQQQASAFKLQEVAKPEGGTDRIAKLDAKGRLEVVRILGAHEAECRILEDKASDPILPGDWIQTPAWSPGQHLGIALVGGLDIDQDGLDDTELIKNLIRINGGTVDAHLMEDGTLEGAISIQTRYLVEGKIPTDATSGEVKTFLDRQNSLEKERIINGVEKVSVREFLDRMGWKPEEKTIGLGGRSDVGAGQFRRRTPGAKSSTGPAATPAPMPGTPMPATPMPATPSTPADADPFGTKG